MNAEQREQILQQLAAAIARRRLCAPARLALDAIAPLGFLASQVALFMRPLTPLGRWHDYVAALEHEQSWEQLRSLVDQQE
ncbi:MAG: hypothetical protein IPO81_30470 [Kouleothrix sp.]|nr:hypothetical protein [Kouleothrix sp.]